MSNVRVVSKALKGSVNRLSLGIATPLEEVPERFRARFEIWKTIADYGAPLSSQEVCYFLNKPSNSVTPRLTDMVRIGILERHGDFRHTKWTVPEDSLFPCYADPWVEAKAVGVPRKSTIERLKALAGERLKMAKAESQAAQPVVVAAPAPEPVTGPLMAPVVPERMPTLPIDMVEDSYLENLAKDVSALSKAELTTMVESMQFSAVVRLYQTLKGAYEQIRVSD